MQSADGTEIGFGRYGAGPAVVLVQGAMGTPESYHELAMHLAPDFTTFVPERRGRPLSPRPFQVDDHVAREVEDVEAVRSQVGATLLFGLSSGAVIALEAARVLGTIRKLVLYEPPLYVPPRRMRLDFVARFTREIEENHAATAMVYALLASDLAPSILKTLPRSVTSAGLALYLQWDERRATRRYPALRELIPSMRYDFGVVTAMQDKFDMFASVKNDVMLLSCVKSPDYLRQACTTLAQVLPSASRVEFDRLDHSGPWNADLGGNPGMVAATIRPFLRS